ncbi:MULTISPECIES: TolC family protein [Marinobacter]|uniref:TolC family protein n=1 Tax=Marinobacter salinexigens TaxID=2919747 RepID=A0A5B0VF37_9GAMM|nr:MULTISPECIES: TolC family protein [Marinobacter]KAA1173212.1 TolC family protein [Marinobacter salinexigens]MBY6222679.1 TolC family protein [Marinobacter nauticus]
MNKRLLLWVLIVPGVLNVMPSSAATAGESVSLKEYQQAKGSQAVSLNEAMVMAFENSPVLALRRAAVSMQEAGLDHASRWAPSNPELELSGRDNPDQADQSLNYEVRVTQEVWMGNRGDLGQSRAQSTLTSQQQELEYLKVAIKARVRSAYFKILLAQKELETATRTVELMQRTKELVEVSVERGKQTRVELNTAVIGLARAKNQKAEAAQKLRQSKIDLTEVLGVSPSDAVGVAGEFNVARANLPPTNRLVAMAQRQRGDLKAAAARIAANESGLELAKSLTIPNLKVFGFYEREESSNLFGAGVSMPLTVFHDYSGEKRKASAQLKISELEAEALRLATERQVVSAVAQYESAVRRLRQMNESILERSEETLQLMQKALQAGKVDASDVLSAQDNLLSVRKEYVQVQHDYIDAVRALEVSTGGALSMSSGS